jgi:hypothetical protein
MRSEPSDRMALLILRAWIEPDGGLRVRIRSSLDVSSEVMGERAVTTVEEAVLVVRRWLEAVSPS